MARFIGGDYYKDNYVKHDYLMCRRSFIVGEALSRNRELSCPYCRSAQIEAVAGADEESTQEMEMGCLGIYFHRYGDGELMLYTEQEFARISSACTDTTTEAGKQLPSVLEAVMEYCRKRDGK